MRWLLGYIPFCSTGIGGHDDGVFVVEMVADVVQH